MADEVITIRGDSRDAQSALDEVAKSAQSVTDEMGGIPAAARRAGDAIEDAADGGGSAFTRLQAGIVTAGSALGGIASGISVFESGVNAIRGIFEDFFDSTEEGAEYTEELTRQFRQLSTVFVEAFTGTNDPREVFEQLSGTLQDVVAIMRSLSRVASVALGPIVDIGTSIVSVFGDVAEAFERNATAISDNERAVQRLTRRYEEAEQAALAQAEAARLAAEQFVAGTELGRAAEQVDRLSLAWRGLVDQLDLAEFAQGLSENTTNRLNQRLLSQSEALDGLRRIFQLAASSGESYAEVLAGINQVEIGGNIFQLAEAAGATETQIVQLLEVFGQLREARATLQNPFGDFPEDAADAVDSARGVSSSMRDAESSVLDLSGAMDILGQAVSSGGVASGMQALRDAVRDIASGGDIEALSLDAALLGEAFDQLAALPDDVLGQLLDDESLTMMAQMVEETTSLEQAFLMASAAADDMAKKVMGVTDAVPSMKEAWEVIRSEGESLTSVTEALGAGLGQAFGNAISGSESLGEGLKKNGKKFVADIAKVYGSLFLTQGAGLAATGNPQGVALIAAGTALFTLAAALGGGGGKREAGGGSAGPAPSTQPQQAQDVYIVDTEGRRSRAVQARELDAALTNAERYGLSGERSYGG